MHTEIWVKSRLRTWEAPVTATPVIYNGRIYVGVAGAGGQFEGRPDGGHFFAVVDSESMTKIRRAPGLKGYSSGFCSFLSTASGR